MMPLDPHPRLLATSALPGKRRQQYHMVEHSPRSATPGRTAAPPFPGMPRSPDVETTTVCPFHQSHGYSDVSPPRISQVQTAVHRRRGDH